MAAGRQRFKMQAEDSDPALKDVMRKFMIRIHPDLFSRFPDLQRENEQSLQALLEVLGQAKTGTYEDHLPVVKKTLVFYVRTDTENHFKKVRCDLRTTGNNCQHVVAKSLSELFSHCGLPTRFRWGDEYWGRTTKLRAARPDTDGDGDDGDDGEADSGNSSAGRRSSDNRGGGDQSRQQQR